MQPRGRFEKDVQKLCAVSRLRGRRARYRELDKECVMRRDKSNRVLAFTMAALAGLAGCASAPPSVVPAGNDAYQLRVSGARYESQADTNIKALAIASDYCAKRDKHLLFRQSTESGEHSWAPKQEDLTFVCSDANDPELVRASAHSEAGIVAQQ
jgi:putative hemolysin